MIRIALADDHQLVIEGLEQILQDHSSEIKVVFTTNSGEELLDKMKTTGVDITVLDISFPDGMSGLDTLKAIKSDFPETKILMLTMHKDKSKIGTSLQHGADGYILKNHGGKELVKAIKSVYSGQKYYSQDVKDVFFEAQLTNNTKELTSIPISPREAEVLALLAEDNSEKMIAEKLNISPKTVETYKRRLKEKTGKETEKGLVRFAVENGYTL